MEEFQRLVRVMARLRGRRGCPWDRRQTHASLLRYLREEVREVERAVRRKDWKNLQEELGDLLLQVVFHSQIAREKGRFTIRSVARGVADKMIRRHPHVFAGRRFPGMKAYLRWWEEAKRREKHT